MGALKKLLHYSDLKHAADLLSQAKDAGRKLAQLQIADYSRKLVINRASLVVYPERQYLMIYQPSKENKLEWFWHSVLGLNCRNIIAAIHPNLEWFWHSVLGLNCRNIIAAIHPNEEDDTADHSLEYWHATLYPLKIDQEWSVELKTEKIIAVSEKIMNCEIIHRKFEASSSRTLEKREIQHFHYKGWRN